VQSTRTRGRESPRRATQGSPFGCTERRRFWVFLSQRRTGAWCPTRSPSIQGCKAVRCALARQGSRVLGRLGRQVALHDDRRAGTKPGARHGRRGRITRFTGRRRVLASPWLAHREWTIGKAFDGARGLHPTVSCREAISPSSRSRFRTAGTWRRCSLGGSLVVFDLVDGPASCPPRGRHRTGLAGVALVVSDYRLNVGERWHRCGQVGQLDAGTDCSCEGPGPGKLRPVALSQGVAWTGLGYNRANGQAGRLGRGRPRHRFAWGLATAHPGARSLPTAVRCRWEASAGEVVVLDVPGRRQAGPGASRQAPDTTFIFGLRARLAGVAPSRAQRWVHVRRPELRALVSPASRDGGSPFYLRAGPAVAWSGWPRRARAPGGSQPEVEHPCPVGGARDCSGRVSTSTSLDPRPSAS